MIDLARISDSFLFSFLLIVISECLKDDGAEYNLSSTRSFYLSIRLLFIAPSLDLNEEDVDGGPASIQSICPPSPHLGLHRLFCPYDIGKEIPSRLSSSSVWSRLARTGRKKSKRGFASVVLMQVGTERLEVPQKDFFSLFLAVVVVVAGRQTNVNSSSTRRGCRLAFARRSFVALRRKETEEGYCSSFGLSK